MEDLEAEDLAAEDLEGEVEVRVIVFEETVLLKERLKLTSSIHLSSRGGGGYGGK